MKKLLSGLWAVATVLILTTWVAPEMSAGCMECCCG